MEREEPGRVVADVVRRRLTHLLAEVAPRRAALRAVPYPASLEAASAEGSVAPGAQPAEPSPGIPRRVVPRFSRRHLNVVVGVGLVGCLLTWWSLTRTRTVPIPAVGPSLVATAFPSTASPVPSASAIPLLVVHVAGAVNRPGVYRLAAGARVDDAVKAAGGPRSGARLGELNLAALLADGAKVLVGDGRSSGSVSGAAGPAGGEGGTVGKVNLNTATQAELEALPGVGPVTARAILAWRSQHGSFTRVEELQEVEGIGPKTYSRLADQVTS